MEIKTMQMCHAMQVWEIENSQIECPWSLNLIEDICKNENAVCRVCIDQNKRVVGYYTFNIVCGDADINNIAVDKSMQGKGIGSILLQDLINCAKNLHINALTLEVNINNIKAVNLYKKFGFEQVGLRKKFYLNTDDAIIMQKK